MADKESFILVWDILVLLLRQEVQLEGSDLAELLLKDSREGVVECRSGASRHWEMEEGTLSSASSICHEGVEHVHTVMNHGVVNSVPSQDSVDKFRSYLHHGNKVEGLEFLSSVPGKQDGPEDLCRGDDQFCGQPGYQ